MEHMQVHGLLPSTDRSVGIKDLTGRRAGAHWRTHANADDTEQCDWDVQTYKAWKTLLEIEAVDSSVEKSGLKVPEAWLAPSVSLSLTNSSL